MKAYRLEVEVLGLGSKAYVIGGMNLVEAISHTMESVAFDCDFPESEVENHIKSITQLDL